MAQRLIVEGNDAIPLAALAKKSGIKPPLGYESETKFKKEFVAVGGGDLGALAVFQKALTKASDFTNIGLVLDANEKGVTARWKEVRDILQPLFLEETLLIADNQEGAKIIAEYQMPIIGVWIMPDNASPGYLEHFLSGLVPKENELWKYAIDTIEALPNKPFTQAKEQKALLHTWLAWQKDPGKPFGQAIASGYLDHNAPYANVFWAWYSGTFLLST
ncbi:MAG: DUF3226 domain-containing protein [Saprospiraceae bacterium]